MCVNFRFEIQSIQSDKIVGIDFSIELVPEKILELFEWLRFMFDIVN